MHHPKPKHQAVSKEQKHSARTARRRRAQQRAQIDRTSESLQQRLFDAQPDEPPNTSLDLPDSSMGDPDYFHTDMSIMQNLNDYNTDDYM